MQSLISATSVNTVGHEPHEIAINFIALRESRRFHRGAFRFTHLYAAATPDFVSPFFFVLSSQAVAHPQTARAETLGLKYYSAEVHAAAFALPAAVEALSERGWNCTRRES